jgi:hypothetical protein
VRIAFPDRAALPPPDEIRAILAALQALEDDRAPARARGARSAWKTSARYPELSYDELRLIAGR